MKAVVFPLFSLSREPPGVLSRPSSGVPAPPDVVDVPHLQVVQLPPRGEWPEPDNSAQRMMAMPEFRDWSMRHQGLRRTQRQGSAYPSLVSGSVSLPRTRSGPGAAPPGRSAPGADVAESVATIRPGGRNPLARLLAQTDPTMTI